MLLLNKMTDMQYHDQNFLIKKIVNANCCIKTISPPTVVVPCCGG